MTRDTLQELFAKYSKEIKDKDGKIFEEFAAAIVSTKNRSVTSRPADIVVGNIAYEFCRNSGHYFAPENMVKDKNGKSKGYSRVGNSIYTAAQNYKKKLALKIDTIKDEIIAMDPSGKSFKAERSKHIDMVTKLEAEIADSKWADGAWMTETFKSGLKEIRQNEFDAQSFTADELAELQKAQ